MTYEYPSYKIDTSGPGSDLAAETAATLVRIIYIVYYYNIFFKGLFDINNIILLKKKKIGCCLLSFQG